jgi:hypothetical protein
MEILKMKQAPQEEFNFTFNISENPIKDVSQKGKRGATMKKM